MKTIKTLPVPFLHAFRLLRRCLVMAFALGSAIQLTSCVTVDRGLQIPAEAVIPQASGTLQAGDVLRVSYPGAPELNLVQRVQPNGRISLPTVGAIQASGRSVSSLQSQLTSMYSAHLQDPTVLVAVEAAASGVYVSGEVLRPGKVPLDRPMTAMEAVMEAGGFTKLANPRSVVVMRKTGATHQRYVLNMSMSGGASAPFYLQPFDVIHVSMSRW